MISAPKRRVYTRRDLAKRMKCGSDGDGRILVFGVSVRNGVGRGAQRDRRGACPTTGGPASSDLRFDVKNDDFVAGERGELAAFPGGNDSDRGRGKVHARDF